MFDLINFIDFETSGLLKPAQNLIEQQPSAIEVCVIQTNQKLEVVNKFETLIRPPAPISEEITDITNITNEMLKNAPEFIEIFDDLVKIFIGCREIVAHNLSFDKMILQYELMRIGLEFNFPWCPIHTCTIEKSFSIEGKRLKLSNLYYLASGEYIQDQHRASSDVYALIEIYRYLKKRKLI